MTTPMTQKSREQIKAEIKSRLVGDLMVQADAIVEGLVEFEVNPCAKTFRDAENQAHALTLKVLDATVAEAVRRTAAAGNALECAAVEEAVKKTTGRIAGKTLKSN